MNGFHNFTTFFQKKSFWIFAKLNNQYYNLSLSLDSIFFNTCGVESLKLIPHPCKFWAIKTKFAYLFCRIIVQSHRKTAVGKLFFFFQVHKNSWACVQYYTYEITSIICSRWKIKKSKVARVTLMPSETFKVACPSFTIASRKNKVHSINLWVALPKLNGRVNLSCEFDN